MLPGPSKLLGLFIRISFSISPEKKRSGSLGSRSGLGLRVWV